MLSSVLVIMATMMYSKLLFSTPTCSWFWCRKPEIAKLHDRLLDDQVSPRMLSQFTSIDGDNDMTIPACKLKQIDRGEN